MHPLCPWCTVSFSFEFGCWIRGFAAGVWPWCRLFASGISIFCPRESNKGRPFGGGLAHRLWSTPDIGTKTIGGFHTDSSLGNACSVVFCIGCQ